MAPVQRIQNICLKPAQEWDAIAGEPSSKADLLKNYALPLAGINAVAHFIGGSLVGRFVPVAQGLVGAALHLVLLIAGAYVLSLIIDALAPRFDGEKNAGQALKVAVYSATPVWAAGVLSVIPALGVLIWLAFIYSLYLLYLGLRRLMKSPAEKALGYTAAVAACSVGIMLVAEAVLGAVTGVNVLR